MKTYINKSKVENLLFGWAEGPRRAKKQKAEIPVREPLQREKKGAGYVDSAVLFQTYWISQSVVYDSRPSPVGCDANDHRLASHVSVHNSAQRGCRFVFSRPVRPFTYRLLVIDVRAQTVESLI